MPTIYAPDGSVVSSVSRDGSSLLEVNITDSSGTFALAEQLRLAEEFFFKGHIKEANSLAELVVTSEPIPSKMRKEARIILNATKPEKPDYCS